MKTKSIAMDGEGAASPGGLGAGSEAGDRLCQFVLEEGQPVAVWVEHAAVRHLKDRDVRTGRAAVTRLPPTQRTTSKPLCKVSFKKGGDSLIGTPDGLFQMLRRLPTYYNY